MILSIFKLFWAIDAGSQYLICLGRQVLLPRTSGTDMSHLNIQNLTSKIESKTCIKHPISTDLTLQSEDFHVSVHRCRQAARLLLDDQGRPGAQSSWVPALGLQLRSFQEVRSAELGGWQLWGVNAPRPCVFPRVLLLSKPSFQQTCCRCSHVADARWGSGE